MRILRLDLDDGEELDLHPYLTVLGGLAPDVHARVVERLVRLARGDGSVTSGLVEAHDVLSEISVESVAALGLPAEVDVVVRAAQLPAAAAPVVAAVAEVERERAAASQQVLALTAQLDEARRGIDDFAIAAHDAAVAALRSAEARAQARLAAGDGLVEDPTAAQRAELALARDEAASVAAELDAERLVLLEMLEDLEDATTELEELRATTGAAAAVDPPAAPVVPPAEQVAAVERAIAAVRLGPPAAPMVESPEAVALADTIAEHRRRHDALEQDLRAEGIDVVALQAELRQVRVDAADAEVAARPKVISPEDDAEIERLHDIVVDQGERRSSRRGGKGAEAAYQDASSALDELLESVGYPTYAAYVMGRISPAVDIDARRRLDELTVRVGELEAMLDQAESLLERDARVLMLRAERDQLWAAARDVLGVLPDDVEGALRSHRVPGDAGHPALDDLRRLLDEIGVDRHGDSEPEVLGAAEAFLTDAALLAAEAHALLAAAELPADPDEPPVVVAERRVAALHRRASEADLALSSREAWHDAATARIAEMEAVLARAEAEQAASTDDADAIARDPEVRDARAQLVLTEARLDRHRAAVAMADQLLIQLREARNLERAGGTPGGGAVPSGPAPITDYLRARVDALRGTCPSGSVPLIVDDAFRGLPGELVAAVATELAGVAREVQILYVGDHPALAGWALAQGLDVAAVVRPGQPAL